MKIIGYLNYDYEHLPDPHLLTHINFSFAELYVRNGVYDHFELCGQNIEKLINVVKLKEINPELKVLISFTSQIHNEDNFQDGGFSAICNDENQYKHLTKDIVDFIDIMVVEECTDISLKMNSMKKIRLIIKKDLV
jgi:chitinase